MAEEQTTIGEGAAGAAAQQGQDAPQGEQDQTQQGEHVVITDADKPTDEGALQREQGQAERWMNIADQRKIELEQAKAEHEKQLAELQNGELKELRAKLQTQREELARTRRVAKAYLPVGVELDTELREVRGIEFDEDGKITKEGEYARLRRVSSPGVPQDMRNGRNSAASEQEAQPRWKREGVQKTVAGVL